MGARGTSCRWLPGASLVDDARGRKFLSDPEVLATTRSDSGPVAKGLTGALLSTTVALVVFARFLGWASSPSVTGSSAPEVFPSAGRFRGRPLGRPVGGFFVRVRLEARLEGLEAGRLGCSLGSTGIGATRWISFAAGDMACWYPVWGREGPWSLGTGNWPWLPGCTFGGRFRRDGASERLGIGARPCE